MSKCCSKWISVKESMPPYGERVLIVARAFGMWGKPGGVVREFVALLCCCEGWKVERADNPVGSYNEVIYWQSIPEIPKE